MLKKRTLALILACLLALSGVSALAEHAMPISEQPLKLTIWQELGAKAATVLTSWNEMEWVKELKKISNVELDFIHPPVGGELEQLNTMISARNLPDLIMTGWDGVTGGPSRMIEEEIIIPLNDYIEQYAPNLTALWEKHPDWKAAAMTDEGYIFGFPHYWGEEQNCHFGFVVRDDWAKKLNVKLPESVDEWYAYLKAVKEGDPNGNGVRDEIPYAGAGMLALKNFQKAFGIRENSLFYLEDNKIACTVEQEEYKQWLSTMQKWHAEGLIDPEILSATRADLDGKVLSDVAGSLWSGAGTGQLGLYLKQKENQGDTQFSLYPVKNPLTAKGERLATYKTTYGLAVAITSSCQNVVEAVKLMDYCYSEEGHKLVYLGPEGVTYENKEDGGIKFTEFVTKNPEGLAFDSAMIKYGACPWSFAGVQFPEYWAQNTSFYPQQQAAYPLWSDVSVDKELPNLRFTVEESSEMAEVMGDINTLLNETTAKIITGQMEVDAFDKTVEQLNSMNLQGMKAIYEAALTRYQNRGK